MSAIVAALAFVAAGTLAGCGQQGPLYMPKVPPLPPKPNFQTEPQQPQPGDVKPTPDNATTPSQPQGSVPDTSGTPLSLTPDDTLTTSPASAAVPEPASPASAASPASDPKPTE